MFNRPPDSLVVGSFLVFGVAWLVPNHYLPWTSFHSDFVAAIAAIGLLGATLTQAGRSISLPASALFALALACIPLFQLAADEIYYLGDAWMVSLYLAGFSLMVVAGRALATPRYLVFFAGTVVVVAMLSVWVAAIQWLDLPRSGLLVADLPPLGRPFANLAQPNQFGTFLVVGLVCVCGLYQARTINASLGVLLATVLLFGLSLNQSRAALSELLLGCIYLTLVRRRAGLRPTRIVLAGVAVFAMIAYLSSAAISKMLLLVASRTLEEQSKSGWRLIHWSSLADAAWRRPWQGYGWGQISVAQAAVVNDHPYTGEFLEHSHNLVLDVILWNGIPLGAAILVCASIWSATRLRKSMSSASGVLLMTVAGSLLVHSMVEFPLDYAYFLLPLGFLVGAVEAICVPTFEAAVSKWFVFAFAAILSIMVVWTAVDYMKIEQGSRNLRLQSAKIGYSGIDTVIPDVLVLTQVREFIRFAKTEATRGMSREKLEEMRRVSERFGYPPVVFRYALALSLNGLPVDAATALARLCKTQRDVNCNEMRRSWTSLAVNGYPETAAVALPP